MKMTMFICVLCTNGTNRKLIPTGIISIRYIRDRNHNNKLIVDSRNLSLNVYFGKRVKNYRKHQANYRYSIICFKWL